MQKAWKCVCLFLDVFWFESSRGIRLVYMGKGGGLKYFQKELYVCIKCINRVTHMPVGCGHMAGAAGEGGPHNGCYLKEVETGTRLFSTLWTLTLVMKTLISTMMESHPPPPPSPPYTVSPRPPRLWVLLCAQWPEGGALLLCRLWLPGAPSGSDAAQWACHLRLQLPPPAPTQPGSV